MCKHERRMVGFTVQTPRFPFVSPLMAVGSSKLRTSDGDQPMLSCSTFHPFIPNGI